MRARHPVTERLTRMKQDFLKAAGEAHPLVLGQIIEQR
jgi:hypothetical protein